MTWDRNDDQVVRHPKFRRAGHAAQFLWFVAKVECCAADTDGLVQAHMVPDVCYFAGGLTGPKADKAVRSLVEVGLWHDHETFKKCRSCQQPGKWGERPPVPAPGDYLYHDWQEYQLPRDKARLDAAARAKDARRKRLAGATGLKDFVRERDRGRCRYCGERCTTESDHRSPLGLTFDHVDPEGDNVAENLVVACRRCNGIKKDRTPEEARMVLLPVPAAPSYDANSGAPTTPGASGGPDPIHGPAETNGSDLGRPADIHGSTQGKPTENPRVFPEKTHPEPTPRTRGGIGPGSTRVDPGLNHGSGGGSDRVAGSGRVGSDPRAGPQAEPGRCPALPPSGTTSPDPPTDQGDHGQAHARAPA